MISYQQFSSDWKGRAAYCATLSIGAAALFLSVFLIAETVYTAIAASQLDDQSYGPSISISGKGKAVATTTDIVATFTFGASATSESVPSAKDQSAKIVNDVLAYLKAQGVDEKDTETQYYNLSPREEWVSEPCPVGGNYYCQGGRSVTVGFTVDQSILVKVRNTDKAGDILSGVAEKNVTSISGLTFTIDEVEKLKDVARTLAIEDARARAEVTAAALGVKLGKVIGMYQSSGPGYPMYDSYEQASAPMGKSISPDVPVGEQEVEVSVDVQFEIDN